MRVEQSFKADPRAVASSPLGGEHIYKSTIDRMRDSYFLHCRVDNDPPACKRSHRIGLPLPSQSSLSEVSLQRIRR